MVGTNQQLDPAPITFTFDNDELATRVRLYSKGLRFMGIQMETNKQRGLAAFGYGYTPCDSDCVEIPLGAACSMEYLDGLEQKSTLLELGCYSTTLQQHFAEQKENFNILRSIDC